MLRLEIVSDNAEMRRREYAGALGAGTSLLLRLAKDFSGSGRVIIADSAFASVKSAVWLKKELGLNFAVAVRPNVPRHQRDRLLLGVHQVRPGEGWGDARRLRPGSHRRSADKKYGVPDSHPVLRPLPEDHSEDEKLLPASVHDLQLLRLRPFFLRKNKQKDEGGEPQRKLHIAMPRVPQAMQHVLLDVLGRPPSETKPNCGTVWPQHWA
jgi:hypothetical protein